jgi:Flp pilus assembly pilin Flp
MQMLLNYVVRKAQDERGVVSVEWILLGAVVMAAIVVAFAPSFRTMLTNAVTDIGAVLSGQLAQAGS